MPNVVKGSKQEKRVVVVHRPGRRLLLALSIVIGIAISAIGGYLYGYFSTASSEENARITEQQLGEDLAEARDENAELRRQVAILERSAVMDQRATQEVQETLTELQEQVIRLEQDVVFYRQAISDEIDSSGIIIGQLDIEGTADPQVFRYKLVLRQEESSQDSFLLGHVNVNVVGELNDEQMVIPLQDISGEVDTIDIRLRYRYFQNIEGELELPVGFMPEQIHVIAISNSPIESQANKSFSWVVERG